MTATNDITGDLIQSLPTEKYRNNYDAIFNKSKVNNPKGTHNGSSRTEDGNATSGRCKSEDTD